VNGATTAFGHDELGGAVSTQPLTAKTDVLLFLFPIRWLAPYLMRGWNKAGQNEV